MTLQVMTPAPTQPASPPAAQGGRRKPVLATKGTARPTVLEEWDEFEPSPAGVARAKELSAPILTGLDLPDEDESAAGIADDRSSDPAASLLAAHITRRKLASPSAAQASDLETSGTEPAGVEPAGVEPAGVEPSGVEPAAATIGDGDTEASSPDHEAKADLTTEPEAPVSEEEVLGDETAVGPESTPEEHSVGEPETVVPSDSLPDTTTEGDKDAATARDKAEEAPPDEPEPAAAEAPLDPSTEIPKSLSSTIAPPPQVTPPQVTPPQAPLSEAPPHSEPIRRPTARRPAKPSTDTRPLRSGPAPVTTAKSSGKRDQWVIAALVVLGLAAVSLIAWSVHGDLLLDQSSSEAEPSNGALAHAGTAAPAADQTAERDTTAVAALAGGSADYLPSETPSLPAQAEAPDVAPRVDVVRIESSGNALIAGTAEPHSELIVLDKGKPIGLATADSRGEWILLPEMPLAQGDHEISLVRKIVTDSVTLPKVE